MNRLSALILAISLLSAAHSQTFTSYIFSPSQGTLRPLPYSEIDFLSVRMQGFGSQLHNVVRDTLTDLFRNPAYLCNLSKSLLVVNYERPQSNYLYREVGLSSRVVRINYQPIYLEPTGEDEVEAVPLFETGVPYYRFSNYNPFLSVGYWGSIAKIPIGVFLTGSVSKNSTDQPSNYPPDSPFDNSYVDRNGLDENVNNIFGQIWIGLVNRAGTKIGLGYNLFYTDYSQEVLRRREQTYSSYTNYLYSSHDLTKYTTNSDWIRHGISLGGIFKTSGWQVEPKVSVFLYSNDDRIRVLDDFQMKQYLESDPDSVIERGLQRFRDRADFQRNIAGGEISLQMQKAKTTLFASGTYLNAGIEEDLSECSKAYQIFVPDTNSYDSRLAKFNFDDSGSLIRFRGGIGREYPLRDIFTVYTAVIFEYSHHKLSGILSGKGELTSFNISSLPANLDTIYHNPLDYTSQQLALLLPVGMELNWKILSLRFGLVWYYWDQNEKLELENGAGKKVFHSKQSGSQTFREQFFGFGLRWKEMEMNVAATSDIFMFSSWNVGFRYYFD